MEHEVFVPFPVRAVRQALTEPERVARCVPGAQLDADAAPHTAQGRLRLRIGGSTITYRGGLTVTEGTPEPADGPAADDSGPHSAVPRLTVEAHGTEARGEGSVAVTLTVRLAPAGEPRPGTTLRCAGTVRRTGRLAEAGEQAAATAGRRLLERFAAQLTADLEKRPVDDAPAAEAAQAAEEPSEDGAPADAPAARPGGVFDTEVPPPSLDPLSDPDDAGDEDADAYAERLVEGTAFDGTALDGEAFDGDTYDDDTTYDGEPYDDDMDGVVPAEAAHARRTMIGRSAEEVDHAPPRGRYAPVPAPEAGATSATLRWAAPAAALVVASAVVVSRVLRRRR